MQRAELKKINVLALFAGFKSPSARRRITPRSFAFQNGDIHRISEIRRSYTERVGDTIHVHFVIRTKEDRYFDIVYDSKKMTWFMVVELEENLLFDMKDEQ